MYSCPGCGADGGGAATCACGADLGLLQRLDAFGDAWFNRALESLAAGKPGQAMEWLSACCVVKPNDAEARRAQARVWAQLGCRAEALDSLDRAAAIDAEPAELEALRRALKPKPQRRKR